MITELTSKTIAVTIPEGSGKFTLRATGHCDKGSISFYDRFTNEESIVLLPPGSWSILGRPEEITEDQWKGIVGWFEILGDRGYEDYSKPYLSYGCATATESGKSLLKSKGLQDKSVIILVKQ